MFQFLRYCRDHSVPFLTEGHHHCHQGWVQTHCILCTDGRSGWHLGFSLERGNLNCWRCGPVRLLDFIRATARTSVGEANRLRKEYDEEEKRIIALRQRTRRSTKPPAGLSPLTKRHIEYLREERGLRNITKLIETWDLQGTQHLSLDWNWRVVSPVRNETADIVAYVGRSIIRDLKPKYRITEDAKCAEDPKGMLYGIDKVPGDSVIIVEGAGDVWKLGPGAVATMGISWRPTQANKLRRFKRRFIMFDPEEEAQESANRLGEALSLFPGDTEVIDGLKSDPGDLSYREVLRIRRELGIGGVDK